MAEYIVCRECSSSNCKGCNIHTLAMMLYRGKFDCIVGDNHSINPLADVAEVVRCKDCGFSQSGVNGHGENIFNCRNGDCGFYGWGMMETDFCSYGERKE